jgi:hypothetical protein
MRRFDHRHTNEREDRQDLENDLAEARQSTDRYALACHRSS